MGDLITGVFPSVCETCGGFSREKVRCLECGNLFHEGRCFEDHPCLEDQEQAETST